MIPRAFTVVLAACLAAPGSPARADKLVLVAGGGSGIDGIVATQGALGAPFGVDVDRTGRLLIIEMTGLRLRAVGRTGILMTLAGTGVKGFSGDGGQAVRAQFDGPHSLAVAPGGDIYVADTWNNRVRKIDPRTGVITTVAGTGVKGFAGDGGPASQAQFGGIYCVALDAKGERLYLADLDNRRIRMVELKTGLVSTVAGNGEKGVPADGADAVASPLVDPRAVAVDREGRLYVLERGGHALRVVDRDGKIRTVVNASGKPGATGDGGDALQATLNGPKHLCLDRDGNVIIADTENHLVRKYLPREGKIVRVAGTGQKGSAGLDGPPEQAQLNQPHGVFVHGSGTLYVADSSNNRVLRIDP